VKRLLNCVRPQRACFWHIGSVGAIAATLALVPKVAQAQSTLPSNPSVVFQTSSPGRCANVGDWYTTYGNTNTTPTGNNTPIVGAGQLCAPTDPAGNQTTNVNANKLHRFLINVTPADLAQSGGSITVTIEDAGTGGALDEVDGSQNPPNTTGSNPPGAVFDPTRFRLLNGSSINSPEIGRIDLDPQTSATDLGATRTLGTITAPGVYTVTSQTGEYSLNGFTGAYTLNRNNDDNGFRIVVSGIQELLIGQFQGTFQNSAVLPAGTNLPFFFLAGPGTTDVFIRNFDLDGDGSISYASPTNPTIPGTVSVGSVWNGGGGLNTGGDSAVVAGLANAGRWGITLQGYGSGFINQSLLEVSPSATEPDPNNPDAPRLPVFDLPPTRAGNFTITPDTTLRTQIGRQVCHGFTVTNNFFTTDIVNLTREGTDPNYTTEYFADEAGTVPLPDTDGDGNPDTGILAANGGTTPTLYLCATPREGAPPQDTTRVVGTSFMDRRVREQAFQPGDPNRNPVPQFVTKITLISAGGNANFRIVKRITNVTRNGAVLPGENYGAVIDDPNDTNDTLPGFSQLPLEGILAQPVSNALISNDEVTYTIYFLADGSAPTIDANICDLIPGGMTFVPGSLQVRLANNPLGPGGNFFTPLAPLPANNSCPIQENPNGAAIFNLGTVSNNAGSNFGFVRFRVRVN
jgi:uncharacterized repeat protein (TIGR01451 family)